MSSLDLIRRVQIPMVTIFVQVEIGDDDALEIQGQFYEALDAMINAPLAGPEDAAQRLRCLAQVGNYYDGDTWTAGRVFDAVRKIAQALAPAARSGCGMNVVDLTLLRARAANAVDRLLDLIDAIDGDADFEMTAVETFGRGFPPTLDGDDFEEGHDAEPENPDCVIGGGAGA